MHGNTLFLVCDNAYSGTDACTCGASLAMEVKDGVVTHACYPHVTTQNTMFITIDKRDMHIVSIVVMDG